MRILNFSFVLLISGIHMYPIFFVGGYTLGHFFYQYRMNYFAERDAVFRHYVELHPEDFPPPGNGSCEKYSLQAAMR